MQSRPLAALLRRSHARSGSVAGRESRWMSTSSFYDSQSGRHITLDEWVRLYDLTAPATELASVDSADDLPASGGVLLTLAARGTEVEGRAEAVVIAQAAKARDMPVRALISNAFGCEEHGSTDPNVLQLVAAELADVGVDVITLGDQEVRDGTTAAAAARLGSHSPATRDAHPPPRSPAVRRGSATRMRSRRRWRRSAGTTSLACLSATGSASVPHPPRRGSSCAALRWARHRPAPPPPRRAGRPAPRLAVGGPPVRDQAHRRVLAWRAGAAGGRGGGAAQGERDRARRGRRQTAVRVGACGFRKGGVAEGGVAGRNRKRIVKEGEARRVVSLYVCIPPNLP